ncbi:MAG: hypothetical protein ACKPH7_09020 [Planktothrix sp.]|uniref:hypothetical protein n=1 Tax=Planktothrix sp. TaxID=3088171 RepID=UPI0038D43F99
MQVDIPIRSVLAIYAQENGKGMIFDEDTEGDTINIKNNIGAFVKFAFYGDFFCYSKMVIFGIFPVY